MSNIAPEALQTDLIIESLNPSQLIEDLDIDELVFAASITSITPREARGRWEHRDLALDNFNLIIERGPDEIGRASMDSWIDENTHVMIIEDLSFSDSLNNHSGYSSLLKHASKVKPNVIEGLPSNDMTAVTLDLDTFNLLPKGYQARYFKQQGAELIELQYPFEVFDNIRGGELVYHYLERIPENN